MQGEWQADTVLPLKAGEVRIQTRPMGGSPKTTMWIDPPNYTEAMTRYPLGFETKANKRTIQKAHEHFIAALKIMRPELFTDRNT